MHEYTSALAAGCQAATALELAIAGTALHQAGAGDSLAGHLPSASAAATQGWPALARVIAAIATNFTSKGQDGLLGDSRLRCNSGHPPWRWRSWRSCSASCAAASTWLLRSCRMACCSARVSARAASAAAPAAATSPRTLSNSRWSCSCTAARVLHIARVQGMLQDIVSDVHMLRAAGHVNGEYRQAALDGTTHPRCTRTGAGGADSRRAISIEACGSRVGHSVSETTHTIFLACSSYPRVSPTFTA
jgi:hypothetical protein